MTPNYLRTQVVTGSELDPWLQAVAELRIRVFRDFPYLTMARCNTSAII